MSSSQSKNVLVTGASSGIGKATAIYLAERGYSVIGTSRSMSRLADIQREASERDLAVIPLELDINSDEAVGGALPALIEERGSIDVLVNNAGYGLWGPIESATMDQIRAQFETNFFAVVRLIKAVLPGMVRQRSGTIVNVSSVQGRLATPFNGAYSASKFALEGLSESLRTELWPLGVRVAVVEPGAFRTDFFENRVVAGGAYSQDTVYSPYLHRYSARHARFEKLAGDPIKVAKVIHKIVRARRPGFRYPVGPEARLGMLAARVLPEAFFRAMLSRATMR